MKPEEKEGKKWCRMRRSVNKHHHPKGTTLGERSGPNEDSHKTNEGLYERKNTYRYLIHRMNSPFTVPITTHPLPSKFKMPTLDLYNRTRDPCDHIATFKSIMCRAFLTTLKGLTRVWFSKLPPNIIASF